MLWRQSSIALQSLPVSSWRRQKCTGALKLLRISRPNAFAHSRGRERTLSHVVRSIEPEQAPGSRASPSRSAFECGQKTQGRAQSARSACSRACSRACSPSGAGGAPLVSSARSNLPCPKSSAAATRPSAAQVALAPQSSRRSFAATTRSALRCTCSPTLSWRGAPRASARAGAFTKRGSTPCTPCSSQDAQSARRACGSSSARSRAPAVFCGASKKLSTLRLVLARALFCSRAWQARRSSARAHSCSVCDRFVSSCAVCPTTGSRPMWQAPPALRLAEVGGARPKPEAIRGASDSSFGAKSLPAVVRWPRRIAKAGRRLLTTQVSSGAGGGGTQRPRADALAFASDISGASRKKPGRQPHLVPLFAYSLSMQSSQVLGKPSLSLSGPASFWK